ncbi:hypothetical protein ACLEPN_11005 [Myxococcus sp. 1LA]
MFTLAGEPFLGNLRKGAGAATLALPAGGYIVTTRGEHSAMTARVQVPDAGRAQLTRAQLRPQQLEVNALKGQQPSALRIHVGPSVGRPLVASFGAMMGGTAALQYTWAAAWANVMTAGVDARHGRHPSGNLRQNDHTLRLGVGHDARVWRSLRLHGAVEVGTTLSQQWQPSNGEKALALQPTVGAVGGAWLPVHGPFGVSLLMNAGHTWVREETGTASALSLGGSLGISFAR